ncbi:MAG: DNA pilot protein [Microviridae sp.]|nr:MAG: DNA pilot protein [Microviridae sp.]
MIGGIGAGIGAVAGLVGGILQGQRAKKAASRQMAFQREMRATQYQTTMQDMKAAGLNPMLAYKQGGAGTPGGSSYTPPNIGASTMQGAVGGATSAKMAKRLNTEVLQMQEDTKLKQDQGRTERYKQMQLEAQRNETYARTKILDEGLTTAKAAAAAAKHADEFYQTPLGKRMRQIDLIGRSINPFATSARGFRGIKRR